MVIIETVLGNIHDANWAFRVGRAQIDWLSLNQWDAQKNRFRRKTGNGVEIAVSLERNAFLQDGDILAWDEASNKMVVAKISLRDVMTIQLSELLKSDPAQLIRTCVELGHALGNQHWPAVVKDAQVYVPLTVDRKVMASVMKTHAFKDVSYTFNPAPEVIPYLAPHESRRLFGGAEQASHSHPDLAEPAHDHDHGHCHDHSH
jgi:urease accessory protein